MIVAIVKSTMMAVVWWVCICRQWCPGLEWGLDTSDDGGSCRGWRAVMPALILRMRASVYITSRVGECGSCEAGITEWIEEGKKK